MADETLEQALDRANAALERIEASLSRPAAATDRKLREAVRKALSELDNLIDASGER